MQYDVTTPSEYIQKLDSDWRQEKLLKIRALIQLSAPKLQEGISYKMLCYGDGKSNVFHLNAQKNYVSLYVGDLNKIDPTGELLKGLNTGKSCIRFSKSLLLSESKIEEFIKKAVCLWEQGTEIGC